MNVEPTVRDMIEKRGLRQTWVAAQMNRIDPSLNMSGAKFSAIVCGRRRMTGNELIAFCAATHTDPDDFCGAAGRDLGH